MKKKSSCIIFLLFSLIPVFASAKTISIYTDDDWFPYVYSVANISTGIQVDIIAEALKRVGHTPSFIPCPWKRCLSCLEHGSIEAVISASYTDERAAYAHYPPDSANVQTSNWRIGQVEYALVTRNSDAYEFKGDFSTLPAPVSVAFGASIGSYLNKRGVETTENVRNLINVRMLLANRTSAIAMNMQLAEELNNKGEFAGQLKIHQHPLRSTSYYLVFSKLGLLSESERMDIWKAIVKVREDKQLLLRILNKHKDLNPTP